MNTEYSQVEEALMKARGKVVKGDSGVASQGSGQVSATGLERDLVLTRTPRSDSVRRYRWEKKRSKLETDEKREARAARWGLGERQCFFCHYPLDPHILHSGAIDIHHLLRSGMMGRNFLENIRLAHHGENAKEGEPQLTAPPIQGLSVSSRRPHPLRPDDRADYSAQKNFESEPLIRAWWFLHLRQHRDIEEAPTPKFLIHNGAALAGENPVTVRRYLDKALAELFGFLETTSNAKGEEVVIFAEFEDYDLTVEQLKAKYPWNGQRFGEKKDALIKEKDTTS